MLKQATDLRSNGRDDGDDDVAEAPVGEQALKGPHTRLVPFGRSLAGRADLKKRIWTQFKIECSESRDYWLTMAHQSKTQY